MMMGKHKVSPIVGWDEVESQIEAWAMFCTLFLGYNGVHPATYNMLLLLEETSGVSPRLQEQARQQPTFPVDLLCLIQQEFKESFCQALERQQRVR